MQAKEAVIAVSWLVVLYKTIRKGAKQNAE
jgi:hypothetical protein